MSDAIGQSIDITGPAGGPAYAALPARATRGVVVIHEILGRQPEIDRVVLRFARAGYAAVAPDLFHGGAPLLCVASAIRSLRAGKGRHIDQIDRARAWLCERAGLTAEAVGVIGFCMGGGFALAVGPRFAAVSTNYGDVPPTEQMRGIGPVIGCYGGRDVLFRDNGALLTERLRPLDVKPEVHVYPDAGHCFLTDGHHPIGEALSRPLMHIAYNPAVAEEAWGKIMAFFERHLTPST